MSESVFAFLSGLPLNWIVFFASAIPITELRAAIPFGIACGMDPLSAWFWGVLGNLLPIPLILLLWPLVYRLFDAIPFTRKFLHRYVDKARTKGQEMEKLGVLGLIIFVGIPLPMTGVWTGSLISYLLGLNPLKSFLCLAAGACIAGIAMTLGTMGFVGLADVIGLTEMIIIAVIIIAVICGIVYRRKKKKAKKT